MIDVGQPLGKCLQVARKLGPIDLGRDDVAFEPGQDLAVEAPAVLFRAFLEPGVQVRWDVLERQRKHGNLFWNQNGTSLE